MSREDSATVLVIYGRSGCHLCQDMECALQRLRDQLGFRLVVRDVDTSPEWQRRYGDRVPVLMAENTELCHYFLDEAGLRRYLQFL